MAEKTAPLELDVRDHLLVLVRRKWVVIGSVVLMTALALVWSYLQTPIYASNAKVLIQKPSANPSDPTKGPTNSDLIAEIELQFFNGDVVKRAAETKLGYPATASAVVVGRGSVLQINVTDTSAQRASDIANRYADAYVETRRQFSVDDFASTAQITQTKLDDIDRQLKALDESEAAAPATTSTTRDPKDKSPAPSAVTTSTSATNRAQRDSLAAQREVLEKNLSQLQISQQYAETGGPQIISPAKPAGSPTSPAPKRDMMLGALVGLLLGVAAAFLIDFLDDSIKGRNDLEAATDSAPILAIIPFLPEWKSRGEAHLASIEYPASPTSEAYRTLRTSVQFAGLEQPIHSLQVTSPRSQDGKSTTSTNIAVALARAGLRVILVDCDLRRPRVHEFFNASNAVGFTSVLLGEAPLQNALQQVDGIPTLHVLASGPNPPNPSELLSGRRAADLVQLLKDNSDILVFDTPPVLPVSDALVISDLMDAVILVVAAGSTTRKEAHRAYEMLNQVEAPVIGTVMNSGPGQSGYGYGFGYGYGYGYEASPTHRSLVSRLLGGRSRSGDAPAGKKPAAREPAGKTSVSQKTSA